MSEGEAADNGFEGEMAMEPEAPMEIPEDRPGMNTGVKGVLADFADAKIKLETLKKLESDVAWVNISGFVVWVLFFVFVVFFC
jgi:hypothetical protein